MKFVSLIAAGLLALATPSFAADAKAPAQNGVNVGTLACTIAPGVGLLVASNKEVYCKFRPVNGEDQEYTGTLSHIGIDVGFTSTGKIVWTVLAPGKLSNGALAGNYVGASVEASALVGAGANVLVGGLKGSVSLQPVSVQGNVGLNAAVAASRLTLDRAD